MCIGPIHIEEYHSVNIDEQQVIDPSPPTVNKFENGGEDINGGLSRVDIPEGPRFLSRHDFEVKDLVFSEVHILLRRRSHLCGTPVHSLALEVVDEESMTVWATQQGLVSVSTEGSGQEDTTEGALVIAKKRIAGLSSQVVRSAELITTNLKRPIKNSALLASEILCHGGGTCEWASGHAESGWKSIRSLKRFVRSQGRHSLLASSHELRVLVKTWGTIPSAVRTVGGTSHIHAHRS